MNDWIKLQEVVFADDIKTLSVDTRDFGCYVGFDEPKDPANITAMRKYGNSFFFTITEVKDLLYRLREESGGEVRWRLFDIAGNAGKGSGWDLKYLRIEKTELGYLVGGRDSKFYNREFWAGKVEKPY